MLTPTLAKIEQSLTLKDLAANQLPYCDVNIKGRYFGRRRRATDFDWVKYSSAKSSPTLVCERSAPKANH
jgi:hypothetical protein